MKRDFVSLYCYLSNFRYKVMLECWHKKPQMRPSFTDLAEKLGNMLEDTVRTVSYFITGDIKYTGQFFFFVSC